MIPQQNFLDAGPLTLICTDRISYLKHLTKLSRMQNLSRQIVHPAPGVTGDLFASVMKVTHWLASSQWHPAPVYFLNRVHWFRRAGISMAMTESVYIQFEFSLTCQSTRISQVAGVVADSVVGFDRLAVGISDK